MNRIIKAILVVILIIAFTPSCSPREEISQGVDEIKRGPLESFLDPIWLMKPIWSPSGEHIAASRIVESDHRSTIYDFDLATGRSSILMSIDGEAIAESWSETNIAIAISLSNEYPEDGIWVFDTTYGSINFVGVGEAAAWSPDGNVLAIYSCEEVPDSDTKVATIRTVRLPQKDEVILFTQLGCFESADMAWSQDNRRIAFSYPKRQVIQEYTDQIYIIDLPTNTTTSISGEGYWSPSFSPNGDKLVFVTDYVLGASNIDGNCQLSINDLGVERIGDISWSPDGTKWAISSLGSLYIIDVVARMGEDFIRNPFVCP